MKKSHVLIYLFILMSGSVALSQTDQYQFKRMDISQGISNNEVNCIFKDSTGFMWFGTMSGINRFDGYHFKTFKNSTADTTSLSDNFISRIMEGPGGNLWVDTRMGYNIFDPRTEKFNRNSTGYLAGIGINDAKKPNGIIKDSKGNFWFYNDVALYLYEPALHKTTRYRNKPGDALSISSGIISSFKEDKKGNYWILYRNGTLEMMEAISKKIFFRTNVVKDIYPPTDINYSLYIDNDGDLWIYSANNPRGVVWYQPQINAVRLFSKEGKGAVLNTNIVNGVIQDDKGVIWIATDHGGINILNKKNITIEYLVNKEDDNKSLSQNSIVSLYKDNTGIIWAGTFKRGVNYFHESAIKFPLYKHQSSNPASLAYDDVNRFAEDAKGNLWIGTNGGGLIYFDRATGKFTSMLHNPANANSIANNVIVSLRIDHAGKLWIGTYYGGLDCWDGSRFTHYRHSDTDSTSLSDDRIWDIFEDSKLNLWVATLGGGVNLLNSDRKTFRRFKATFTPASIYSNFVFNFLEDKQGDLWMATSQGLDVRNARSGNFKHYAADRKKAGSLSNGNINAAMQDSRGIIWISTRDGLNVFNEKTKTFSVFRTEDGLPDNHILNVLEANDHKLWLSTPNGLSCVTVVQNAASQKVTISCKNYDEFDGLQGREFNANAVLKTSRGEMIFGGANGFNLFNPTSIIPDKSTPVLRFTDFELFNKPLAIGEEVNGHVVLPLSISQTKELHLRYNENIISIAFAALNFTNADKIKYAYKLEGFNKDWVITDGKQRRATYTNLDPGTYTFRVKASADNSGWDKKMITLIIKISPPFWKTTLAYFIYLLLLIAALIAARRFLLQRAKMRFNLEQERQEAQRMHELDMMKIKFFTNVSHEFRTPLSLILSPVEKMIQQASDGSEKKQYQMIHRNARRLLNMVNQLLDFRKMEVKELRLYPMPGDIIRFIKEISYSFTDLAENKAIRFAFNTTIESLETKFDQDKVERILFNLLSNAFKFTQQHGVVSVEVDYKPAVTSGPGLPDGMLEIKVQDTGIGIEPNKQDRIFERFFQTEIPGSIMNQGSGIGLAITREFVKLHGGTIAVESEPDKGSCFTVCLPLTELEVLNTAELHGDTPPPETTQITGVTGPHLQADIDCELAFLPGAEIVAEPKLDPRKPVVLLVEDNDDFRFYLKENLAAWFNIIEAANGKEGWQKALAMHPGLVVSDISMPEMTGTELCKKIKTDPRTKHIPVILLTAITGEEQLLQGLETGANDYMTKPFNFEVLLSRIKNILQQQESLKKTFKKQVEVKTGDIELASPDETFIQQAVEVAEKKMGEPEFSVEDLSREMCMSRVGLYKKLLTLTGKTPIEFIRNIRLKRAAQLLEKSNMTVAEVAYEIGFNNPKYFAKYFKQEFGVLPSAYMAEKKKDKINMNQAVEQSAE